MDNTNNLPVYDILGINKNATDDEIKKAYKFLILKFHPDKNQDIDATEKFIQIHKSYQILINKNTRKEYDYAQNKNKYFNSDLFFTYFTDDEKFLHNIREKKYTIAMMHIIQKYTNYKLNNNLNIVDNIYCDLIDKYNNNYMLVEIIRKTKTTIQLYIPLRNDTNIYYGEGEIDIDGNNGDLILNTKILKNNGYYFKKHDMFKIITINDSDNTNINYQHIDGTNININKNDFIDNKYYILYNLGLPKSSNSNDRGDLICEFDIKKKL